MYKRLCIIPARGGSKRIPGKNTGLFLGKPILHYSIEAAKASGLFDEIMVSTDDKSVAAEGLKAGATLPFYRSEKNADDFATTAEVLREVLERYAAQNIYFHEICCLYPTAVFTRPHHLIAGWGMLQENAEVVYPMLAFDYPIWRAIQKEEKGWVSFVWPEHAKSRSQDLPPVFHDAGQWYWLKTDAFMASGEILGGKAKGLKISRLEAQDIDDMEDWTLAELKYQKLLNQTSPNTYAAGKERLLGFIPVNESHGEMLLAWRNEDETRAQSVHTEPISTEAHWTWLRNKLKDPHHLMCMAIAEHMAIGVVRADKDAEGFWWLSWMVAPESRGKGYGKMMVKKWVQYLHCLPIKALIKKDNLSSERIALEAGLVQISSESGFHVFSNEQHP
jgi:pseudaminic acid cytidylyltransferase